MKEHQNVYIFAVSRKFLVMGSSDRITNLELVGLRILICFDVNERHKRKALEIKNTYKNMACNSKTQNL